MYQCIADLPPTGAQFGRRSKPRTHRLYISRSARFTRPSRSARRQEVARTAGRGARRRSAPNDVPAVSASVRRARRTARDTIAPAVINPTACAWLAIGSLVRRHVLEYASERPGPDLPDLLAEADPKLGEAAWRWLQRRQHVHRSPLSRTGIGKIIKLALQAG